MLIFPRQNPRGKNIEEHWENKRSRGTPVSAVISGAAKIGLSYKDLRGAALWSGGWHPGIPSGKYSCH